VPRPRLRGFELALWAFEEKWGERLPVIGQAWRDAWEYVITQSDQTKGHFPLEDAARKLIYLAIRNAVPQWTRTRGWTKTLLAFKVQFRERLPD
jgi:putative transposase